MRRGLWAIAALAVGCTLGVRAQGAFETEQPLGEAQVLIVDLPSTPINVAGCDGVVVESCPASVMLRGRWHAIGSTRAEARRIASRPAVVFEPFEALLRLSAVIPLDVEGLVDLEVDTIGVPRELDLELRTSNGDVSVQDMASSVSIDVDEGDVRVEGPVRGLAVHVGQGAVFAKVAGAVEVEADRGGVYVEQTSGAADLRIDAPRGDVEVSLSTDADVDIEIRTPGRIQVQTDNFTAHTSGRWDGRSGAGSFRVEIVCGGDVQIR